MTIEGFLEPQQLSEAGLSNRQIPEYDDLRKFVNELRPQLSEETFIFNSQVKDLEEMLTNYSPSVVLMRALNQDCDVLIAAGSKRYEDSLAKELEFAEAQNLRLSALLKQILLEPNSKLYTDALDALSVRVSVAQALLSLHPLTDHLDHLYEGLEKRLVACEAEVLLDGYILS